MLWDMAVLSPLISRTRSCYNLYDMQHQREFLRRQGIGYRTLKARVVRRPCPMGDSACTYRANAAPVALNCTRTLCHGT